MFDSDKEIGESLDPSSKPKSNLKLYVIIGVSVVVVVAIVVTVILLTRGDDDSKNNEDIKTHLSNIPLPEDIIIDDGHYMFDGNIFICYKRSTTNFTYFGVISDDGKNFKELYGEEFIVSPLANGIRLIPFRDGKRIYLGDFVFECNDTTKNISSCEKGVLIPVNYPEEVVNNNYTYKTWSEMVVAPDNIHVAWTSLNMACGAVNFLGKFKRTENSYEIEESKIISTINFVEPDPTDESILITKIPRGGEIKQFIEGGNALTLVGTQPDEFVKSVYQSLKTEEVYTYSHEPGYDETSILSPDEKLGITMSTRFSPKTNMAIFGLMPRPHCSLVLSKIVESVYTYAVTNVRKTRKGNVGPVLFVKEKSINDPNYHGIDLHDTEEKFVFCSPISWHPSNLKAIWPEVEKGTSNRRLRKLEISNYTPSAYPKIENTTDNVPYALDMSEMDNIHFDKKTNGTIKGKKSGEIIYYNSGFTQIHQTVKITYVNYSDDGKKFYNGEEEFIGDRTSKNVYKSNVILSGSESGQNNFTITFNTKSDLIKEETEGYASYGGKTIKAEDYEA
jgi:hypothetical protein